MLLNQQGIFLLLGLILLWLAVGSFFLYRTLSHYQKLTRGITRENLGSVLEKILKEQGMTERKIEELVKRAARIEEEGKLHIQKIGLVRFNPFPETGGDQSFALAILDGENSGIIISSLHSRQVTRIYAKPIKEGKVEGYKFSKEEIEALKKAR